MSQSFITGVDIGHKFIKAVVLKPGKNTCKLVGCYQVSVDADILTDNDRSNYQEIVKKLKELRKALPLFSRKVCLSIPDNMVITKQLQLDSRLNQDEFQFAIKQALSEHLVIDPNQLYFDFVALPSHSETHSRAYQVYAAHKRNIDDLMSVCSQARLKPLFINPCSFNLMQIWRNAVAHYQQDSWLLIELNSSQLAVYFESELQGCVYHAFESGSTKVTLSNGLRSLYLHIHLLNIKPEGIWLTGESRLNPELVLESIPEWKLTCIVLPLLKLLESNINNQPLLFGEFSRALGLALSGKQWLESLDDT
ncbi:pilus assembly protein PilM [Vibrio sp. Of14-4]|uniref:type IV pilus biogenesis protein PilM n=1 Tax=Vibrio sp. Of14-4 TaxID=2724878 RepID=UPI001EF347B8|nr:pilus assembly protein PilM [Vibrio sp. Of14-4]MCG7489742.1 pilus assembly protein PilM [Vibrio sp. Of14-4]